MGQLKTTNLVVLAKIETTPGTAETLVSGGAPASGVSVIPVTEIPAPEVGGEELVSNVIQNGFQNTPGEGLTAKTMTFTLNTEFAPDGGGTIATGQTPATLDLPYQDVLYKISGLVPEVDIDYPTASNMALRYKPDSDQALTGATATIGIWIDGRLFTAAGCRADLTLTREVGQKDMANFAVQGAYVSVDDTVTALTATNPTYTATVGRSADFTFGTITVATSACASSWEFTTQSEVTQRRCLNAEDGIASYDITNRDPQVSTTVEAFAISTSDKQGSHGAGEYYDVYAAMIAGTTGTMTIDFDYWDGSANVKAMDWTGTCQPTSVPHSDENGLLTHSGLTFRVVSTSKDADFSINWAEVAYT